MSIQADDTKTEYDFDDNLIDSSINDARWLLGGVATLCFIVIGFGFLANTLAV